MKRVFVLLIAGTMVSGIAAYVATQGVEAKETAAPTPASPQAR
jgi:hypothetical protein